MNNQNQGQNPIPGFNIVTGPESVPGATLNTPETPSPVPQTNNLAQPSGVTLGQVMPEPTQTSQQPPIPQQVTGQPTAPQPVIPQPLESPAVAEPSATQTIPQAATLNQMGAGTMPTGTTPIQEPGVANTNQVVAPTGQAPTEETPKKKSVLPIILLAVILLLVGGFCLYYFVLDNPKTIFIKATETMFAKVEENLNRNNGNATTEYTLGLNLSSEDEQIKPVLDIVNAIKLTGTYWEDGSTGINSGTITYKDNELINYGLQIDKSDVYIKLNDIYDKAILISDAEQMPQNSIDMNDYRQLESSIKAALLKSLDGANYKKEMVSLNGDKAKKITLNVDEKFLTTMFNLLLQDSKFIDSYAKITAEEKDEVTELLRKSITDAKNNDEDISIYLSLKNEFKKLEYSSEKDLYSVEINNDQYNFSIAEDDNLVFDGYFKLSETNGQNFLNISLNAVEEKLRINANVIYKVDNTKTPELMDVTDAVKAEELSEEDTNNIMSKLLEKEAVAELIKDIGLDEESDLTLSSDL